MYGSRTVDMSTFGGTTGSPVMVMFFRITRRRSPGRWVRVNSSSRISTRLLINPSTTQRALLYSLGML
ncbi:MAG: hypothetical protein LBF81_05310 [Prevotellaceae bacterium]|nr:hypothetical protein [Prevotellaceae bacterium]